MDPLIVPTGAGLWLGKTLWDQMVADVIRHAPAEACGLIAGREHKAFRIYEVTNQLDSQVRFRMEPREQLDAMLKMDEAGWELLAIYHSHPAGPAHPSPTDLEEFAYPGVLTLIWSPLLEKWDCRAFRIDHRQYVEEPLHLIEGE